MDHRGLITIGEALYAAEKNAAPVRRLSRDHPELTTLEAYNIQLAQVELRAADGQTVIGKKIGMTSLAVQAALGIGEPDYGHIFDAHLAGTDAPLEMSGLITPQVEAELAFVLSRDLKGPGVTAASVMAATEGIIPALEIVDSRYEGGMAGISLNDSIADNASLGRIILGSRLTPVKKLDLRTIGLVLEKNGQAAAFGVSAAVMGSPAASVAWLANKLAAFGLGLMAGEIILSGSFTTFLPAAGGDCFSASFGDGLGSVKVGFK